MTEQVTISKEEYIRLQRAELFLEALEANGVDNWDWYSEAYNDFMIRAKEKGLLSKEELEELAEEESDDE